MHLAGIDSLLAHTPHLSTTKYFYPREQIALPPAVHPALASDNRSRPLVSPATPDIAPSHPSSCIPDAHEGGLVCPCFAWCVAR